MSSQSIRSNIERLQRDIQSCQNKLTGESKKEAQKTERIYQLNQAISRTSIPSIVSNKQREIARLERDIVQIQKKKANLTKRIGDKTKELHKYQQRLSKEESREQERVYSTLRRQNQEMQQRQEQLLFDLSQTTAFQSDVAKAQNLTIAYDAFISHANEDKEVLVRPLAEKLKILGFSIWYDEFQLQVGDSLRQSIDKGLANSRFGIVVLSSNFFSKNWPQYELDGLVAKEMSHGKTILPLWHKVSKDEVMQYSPSLADRVALNTAIYSLDELAEKLGEVLSS